MKYVFVILAALLVDLLISDPPWLPHPVRFLGRVIAFFERLIRRLGKNRIILTAGGTVIAVILPVAIYLMVEQALAVLYGMNREVGILCEVYLLSTAIALKGLATAAQAVRRPLAEGSLSSARERVGEIVGRETAHLDTEGVTKAAVESVAENTVDAVVAPLFFAFIGGAPLALAYRTVNTLDSMIGYPHGDYRYLGWASARLDDLLNYLPARLTGALFVMAAFLRGGDWRRVWRMLRRDARKHPSPNSGIPEAAMAGYLGVELGGACRYRGVVILRPGIGERVVGLEPGHIHAAVKMLYTVAALAVLLGSVFRLLGERLTGG
ncbi:MAG TPA: cobalamin biosynthesis protein CobD [Desulfotomaculum sp.]|nr:cobalamin biosynthesis protein CobD [Desulfotomaculum sp.]